jgi:hypothetical protein
MGQQPNLFRHSLREGGADLWNWSKGHIAGTALALLTALVGIPAYLLLTGGTMIAFREQLAQVAAYSVLGPTALIVIAYVYFCLRAPYKLYAKRVRELRDLRIRFGEPIDDLDEPPLAPNRFRRIFAKYAYPVALVLLLCLSGFFIYVIVTLGRAFLITNAAVKSYQADAMAITYINLNVADQAVRICDDHKLMDSLCNNMRIYDRKLLANFHSHFPRSLPRTRPHR